MHPHFSPYKGQIVDIASMIYSPLLTSSTHRFISSFDYSPVNYQAMLLRATTLRSSQVGAVVSLAPHSQNFYSTKQEATPSEELRDVKQERELKVESSETEVQQNKTEPIIQVPYNYNRHLEPNAVSLKQEVAKMLDFILANMGRSEQTEIQKNRNLYLDDPALLQVYDKVVMKYFSAKKNKEDIVRYILRKVFKEIRTTIMKKEKVSNKQASLLLYKRFFEKDSNENLNITNEDEILELFMPYKKKSKNRTMNTNFVLEVFSSELFCQEYQQFLNEFDKILLEDNRKKKEKFLKHLMESIMKNSLSGLGSFNRLPWLDVWIEDTRRIAASLMTTKLRYPNDKKKLKSC